MSDLDEEEKKALKEIKYKNNCTYCNKYDVDFLINLIEKQESLYNKEKEKNKKLEKQMRKDLDVVYLKAIYDERDKWKAKIREKIEELEKECKDCRYKKIIDCAKNCSLYLTNKILKELLKEK